MIKTKSVSLSVGAKSLLMGFTAVVFSGCASNGVRQQATYDRKVQRTQELLIASADADSLAAAAMLSFGPAVDPVQRLTLIARAVSKAPDRPDLVWLNIRLCAQVPGCNPQPAEAQLRALDYDNGAAWFDSIARAGKSNDVSAMRTDLSAIATAKRFDMYWNATIVHLTNAILKTHTMDLPTALVATIGIATAIAIPPYQTMVNACKGDPLLDPDVLRTCRQVSAVMRVGDTYMTEMVGIAIAKRAWPEDSPTYLDAVSARRVGHYRMDSDGKIALHQSFSSDYAALRLRLMTEMRTEQEVILAEILKAKWSPSPPSDYIDGI